MAEESLFLSYVRHIFKKWVGFQAAIDAGMGGPYAREKEEWLGTEVERYFTLYVNVNPDELEEYLGEILENEFDTYCEDGSLKEVSITFCNAYKLSLSNPNAEIFQEIKENIISQRTATLVSNSEELERNTPVNSVTKEMANLTVNENDEGWTLVSSKNRKPH